MVTPSILYRLMFITELWSFPFFCVSLEFKKVGVKGVRYKRPYEGELVEMTLLQFNLLYVKFVRRINV